MSDLAQYRFLPWARRGLSAAINNVDDKKPLPKRANIQVGITISNVDPAKIDLSLYGPGDVLGVDPNLIVRTTPIAGTTSSEPNYFAGIEFDPPDFVWMFTPAKADARHRLRPWLVLIVCDRALVAPPTAQRGQPLPVLEIPADVSDQELPDLSESWAWAHSQMVTGGGPMDNLAQELENSPDLNVSRLLCPRRLKASKQYVACLVPAFDAGVERGLGRMPDPQKTDLGPAWDSDSPGKVVLPVYYHWEFATGPLGDFGSLARKLKPFESPESVGVTPMYVGDGIPTLAPVDPSQKNATVMMDGALRAPARKSGTLADVPNDVEKSLRDILNTPAAQLAKGPVDATPVLGPPIYGQWHQNRHTLPASQKGWLSELNVDPRARVAAGLGAEVVRKFQEEFMQSCWEQVGEVLLANNQLNWARVSLEANRRLYLRHYKPLPIDRFLQITRPLHTRTLLDDKTGKTIWANAWQSSMPLAMVDMAFRRLTSPQRPLFKNTVRRLAQRDRLKASVAKSMQFSLLSKMAAGSETVDPTRFTPDGLKGSFVIDRLIKKEFSAIAGQKISISAVNALKKQVTSMTKRDFQKNPLQIEVRENLRKTGLVTTEQIDNIRILSAQPNTVEAAPINIYSTVDNLLQTTLKNPKAKGVQITIPDDGKVKEGIILKPISLDRDGSVLLGELGSRQVTKVGTIDVRSLGDQNLEAILSALPANTFAEGVKPNIRMAVNGDLRVDARLANARPINIPLTGVTSGLGTNRPFRFPGVRHGTVSNRLESPLGARRTRDTASLVRPEAQAERLEEVLTNTLPIPLKSTKILKQFEQAIAATKITRKEQSFNAPIAKSKLVAFPLEKSTQMLLSRLDPTVMVPRRLQEIVKLQRGDLWRLDATDLDASISMRPTFDRIMAAPKLPTPTYQYLADYAQERFCPGIGVVPPNSMTLLETNPRFIESFMVGLNYEMNRELLWREYPTDQRGTPFRHFWDWSDGSPDIKPIHRWSKRTLLGKNTKSAGSGGQVVLLIRGELLRRYPNAVVLAWKATKTEQMMLNPNSNQLKQPIFQGKLKPDVTFAGFDLHGKLKEEGGWFFVIQEQPTEPRFGLDVGKVGKTKRPETWNDATWVQAGVAEGQHLQLSKAGSLKNLALPGSSLRFGENGAHMASITLQKPVRIAIHAKHLV